MHKGVIAAVGFLGLVTGAARCQPPARQPADPPELMMVLKAGLVEARWGDRGESYTATAKTVQIIDGTLVLTGEKGALTTVRGLTTATSYTGARITYTFATGAFQVSGSAAP